MILAVAGILFLTMYPFGFSFHTLPGGVWPFLLGRSLKGGGPLDTFLNVLLFIPFGFGLAEKLRERGKTVAFAAVTAFAAGALFSYTIELLQLYIPERDSGWEDVITNSSGSLIGASAYLLFGAFLIRVLGSIQHSILSTVTRRRLALGLSAYFCLWCGFSALLQTQTRLSNWRSGAMLVLGSDGAGQYPWQGRIQSLQIWDRAAKGERGAVQTPREGIGSGADAALIDYDFSTDLHLSSGTAQAPQLFWVPAAPIHPEPPGLPLDARSWASTRVPVADLIENVRKTNQFAIKVICTPGNIEGADGRIVSISDSSGADNITLHQYGKSLFFWFRSPLATRHSQLGWYIPDVFMNYQPRNVLYSYDGSNLQLTLDGAKQPMIYKLGPGTALARSTRRVKVGELAGYTYAFYASVFFTAGAMLGFGTIAGGSRIGFSILMSSFVVMTGTGLAIECILAWVSGRMLSFSNVAVAVVLGVSGLLWSAADNELPSTTSHTNSAQH